MEKLNRNHESRGGLDNSSRLKILQAREDEIRKQIDDILVATFVGDANAPDYIEKKYIFEERREYELRKLSEESYYLNIEIESLSQKR